jgi:hypothetical protein
MMDTVVGSVTSKLDDLEYSFVFSRVVEGGDELSIVDSTEGELLIVEGRDIVDLEIARSVEESISIV